MKAPGFYKRFQFGDEKKEKKKQTRGRDCFYCVSTVLFPVEEKNHLRTVKKEKGLRGKVAEMRFFFFVECLEEK